MDAQIATNGDGDYALGFTIDGAFVPFSTVPAQRIAHLVERQATLKARQDDPSHEGHAQALEAGGLDWTPVGTTAKTAAKTTTAKEA